MKKLYIAAALALVLAVSVGCKREKSGEQAKDGKILILTSFTPIWIFTANVVGERPGIEIEVLIPGHQGPHDYQLTPNDMKKIAAADVMVINGFGLEEFLVNTIQKSRPGLNIIEAAKAVEPIMEGEDEEGADEDHGHHHHGGINPHPFASPRDAAKMVLLIGEELAKADPGGAAEYRKNAAAYAARLDAIADEIKKTVAASKNPRVVTFHNAFDYFARDSGLVIAGSIETVPGQEPSAGELSGMIRMIKESGVVAIFSEPQYSDRVARVLHDETGVPVDVLDPGHTGELRLDYYETVMRKNNDTLRKYL